MELMGLVKPTILSQMSCVTITCQIEPVILDHIARLYFTFRMGPLCLGIFPILFESAFPLNLNALKPCAAKKAMSG